MSSAPPRKPRKGGESHFVPIDEALKSVEKPPPPPPPHSKLPSHAVSSNPFAEDEEEPSLKKQQTNAGGGISNVSNNISHSTNNTAPVEDGVEERLSTTPYATVTGGESSLIFHKQRMSDTWLIVAVSLHLAQFGTLLGVASKRMSASTLIVTIILVVLVTLLLIGSRMGVKKKKRFEKMSYVKEMKPEDETDDIEPWAVYMLGMAAVLEGCTFAFFTAVTAGTNTFANEGFYSQSTLLQILQFASITFLAFHRC